MTNVCFPHRRFFLKKHVGEENRTSCEEMAFPRSHSSLDYILDGNEICRIIMKTMIQLCSSRDEAWQFVVFCIPTKSKDSWERTAIRRVALNTTFRCCSRKSAQKRSKRRSLLWNNRRIMTAWNHPVMCHAEDRSFSEESL